VLRSCWLVWRLRPDVVVGTGGYISLPTCLAAWLLRKTLVVQEQNAHAGVANRLLGRLAAAVFLAFPQAAAAFPRTPRCAPLRPRHRTSAA
jgi:UDP-N-acetylglucosamine--N-acetylmuramyl-(pentapeptide) pyrophosphoryl-undecaprenol N-acetylglucosamine transferase